MGGDAKSTNGFGGSRRRPSSLNGRVFGACVKVWRKAICITSVNKDVLESQLSLPSELGMIELVGWTGLLLLREYEDRIP